MAEWKKFLSNQKLDIALSRIGVVSDIASGKGVVKSIGAGVLDYAKWDIIGGIVGAPAMGVYMGAQLLTVGSQIALENGRANADKIHRNSPKPGVVGGYGFFDNENAYTMRQRSLNAIGGHQGIVNNALGSEARSRAYNIKY